MAWTTPSTFVAGATLTAATLNAQIRDNFNAAFPVGSIHYFMQAGTSTETLINGFALEMNAVSVLRATYSNLNTLLGGLSYPFGSVDGTHFTLPDAKGRSLYHMAASGNADVNGLGDSDALTLASRSPKHNTTVTGAPAAGSLAVSGAPGIGTLALTGTLTNVLILAAGSSGVTASGISATASTTTLGLGGAPSVGSLAVSGSPGIGTLAAGVGGTRPNDLTPWLVAGVYAVKT